MLSVSVYCFLCFRPFCCLVALLYRSELVILLHFFHRLYRSFSHFSCAYIIIVQRLNRLLNKLAIFFFHCYPSIFLNSLITSSNSFKNGIMLIFSILHTWLSNSSSVLSLLINPCLASFSVCIGSMTSFAFSC